MTNMTINNEVNPLQPRVGLESIRVEKFRTRSGQSVEIRWLKGLVSENGVPIEESCFEVFPPLTDNRIPDSVADIRECCICLGLFHKENIQRCPVCGRDFDSACRGTIATDEGEIIVCAACDEEHNRSLLGKLIRKLWTLGE